MSGGRSDKPREACGVFGIWGPGQDVARLTYYGLYALQHRGQESAGIAVGDGRVITSYKAMGLVSEVFNQEMLASFQGHVASGHVRYSTTGTSNVVNAQPLVFHCGGGMLALAHNGNLTNASSLRRSLYDTGSVFQSTTDSEVIVNLVARYAGQGWPGALVACMSELEGAYALVVMTASQLLAVRDPFGFRPLVLGRRGSAWVVASESCALDTVGATFLRDVAPGEILVIDENGVSSHRGVSGARSAHCIFEYIYFARGDSTMDGFNVNLVRREMGRQLAREYRVAADLVLPVPDSGLAAARGFAEQSGLPYEEGLMKNRYIGRTFIQPDQGTRDLGVRLKLNPIREVLAGRRVILVDDSLVRGTTSGKLVAMLRECGAKEVHLCLSSPPVKRSCFYGIDTSNEDELIASKREVTEIRRLIGADGLHYLSLDGLMGVFGGRANFCHACYTGEYPVAVTPGEDAGKFSLECGC
ncbi:MAG: amidophosphoribosyltransferase [Peptococcaceae bacterium]|jgi:amidophosphoribosyltransferase|nr:amidophosphoribosyltransferase [Peptococcaceae bacterium]